MKTFSIALFLGSIVRLCLSFSYRMSANHQFLISSKFPRVSPLSVGKIISPQGKPRKKDISSPDNLRIIGGTMKGKKLQSPNVYLRPMMAKVRAAVFNTLYSILDPSTLRVTRVLDVYSGSGSVGLEALSRGASHATFVDLSSDCVKTCTANAQACGFSEQGKVTVIEAPAEHFLSQPSQYGELKPYGLVFLSPPYEEVSYPKLLEVVCASPLIESNSIVVIEYPVEIGCLPAVVGQHQLIGLRNRKYGRTVLAMYINRPTSTFDFRPDEFNGELR